MNSGGGAGKNKTGDCGGTCYTGYGGVTGFGLDGCCDDNLPNLCCLNQTAECGCSRNCCRTGCCNNTCCPAWGSCCQNKCCAGPCCNNTCCQGNRTCCNGSCCDANCCNGICCDGACCDGVCYPGIFCCTSIGGGSCTAGVCCSGKCCLNNSNTTCTVYPSSSSSNTTCFSRRSCGSPYTKYDCCCHY